ncbi:hypothetical protein Ocin01_03086, partial [Orchesella cincta]
GLFPLGLPILLITIIPFLLVQDINGQPNYYFKASAPAVKSLPRIGRRSDDGGISDTSFPSNGAGGQNLLSLSKSLESYPPGILELWNNNPSDSFGGNVGSLNRSPLYNLMSSSGVGPSSLIPPIPVSSPSSSATQLEKSVLWRKLMGDINNYDEAALLENLYHSKS